VQLGEIQVEIRHAYAHTTVYYWHYEPNVISFRCIVTVCLVSGFRFSVLYWFRRGLRGFWFPGAPMSQTRTRLAAEIAAWVTLDLSVGYDNWQHRTWHRCVFYIHPRICPLHGGLLTRRDPRASVDSGCVTLAVETRELQLINYRPRTMPYYRQLESRSVQPIIDR